MTVTLPSTRRAPSGLGRLIRLLERLDGSRVSLGDMLDALGPGAWGLCFLLLGGAGFIPGVAPVFGVALIIAALGLTVGLDRPRLPARMRAWRTDRTRLKDGLARMEARLARAERWLRPRGETFLQGPALRLAGSATLINGVLIVLPVPFGNTAPAIAVMAIALGLIAGDGIAVLAGLIATGLAMLVDGALVWFGYRAVAGLVSTVF